jgi:hypothetical protein
MPSSRLTLLAVALAVAALLPASGAGTASAHDWTATGEPGGVVARTNAAGKTPVDIFEPAVAAIGFDWLWVTPSPASSQAQLVTVQSTAKGCAVTFSSDALLAFGCGTDGSRTANYYAAPGGWRELNPKPLVVSFPTFSRRYFAQLTVTWYSPSGAQLGQATVDYRGAGDGRCVNSSCAFEGAGDAWAYEF